MNEYFSTIGQKLNDKCPLYNKTNNDFNIPFFNHCFHFHPVTEEEIHTLLNELKTNKSNGLDEPSNYFYKVANEIISPLLCLLINNCLEQGIFPDVLKIGTVIPIFKSGDRELSSNWRPICLLHPFSKVFERCVVKQVNSFLDKYSILHPSQFGFRKNLSTEQAVSKIYDKYSSEIDKGNITCSIFIDIKKAFDTVSHNILLNKLYRYGFRGTSFDFFSNYLTNRFQTVSIHNIKSDPLQTKCGVPQGSVLGPVLFNISIDLPQASNLYRNITVCGRCLYELLCSIPNILRRIR